MLLKPVCTDAPATPDQPHPAASTGGPISPSQYMPAKGTAPLSALCSSPASLPRQWYSDLPLPVQLKAATARGPLRAPAACAERLAASYTAVCTDAAAGAAGGTAAAAALTAEGLAAAAEGRATSAAATAGPEELPPAAPSPACIAAAAGAARARSLGSCCSSTRSDAGPSGCTGVMHRVVPGSGCISCASSGISDSLTNSGRG